MKRIPGWVIAALAIVVVIEWYFYKTAKTALGPVQPVAGNPDVDQLTLCNCSPLNSFGPACQGLTWDYSDDDNEPRDYRTALAASCTQGGSL